MKNNHGSSLAKALGMLSLLFFLASSGSASVVTWSLVPLATEGVSSQIFTSAAYSLTATGRTTGIPSTTLGLYFEAGAVDFPPLGVVSTSANQLESNSLFPTGAVSGGILPVAFHAALTAVPEMGALFPILGLIIAVSLTELLRRRRIAQTRSGSR